MKRVCMVLAPNVFREIEYLVPLAFFEQAGFEVITTSTELLSVGRFGLEVYHDGIIHDYEKEIFDALVLVGGSGSLVFQDNLEMKSFFQKHLQDGKVLAAICAAPRNFLSWGIMSGKKITGNDWDGNFEALSQSAGAIYSKEGVTIDGNIITADGPESSEEFTLQIIQSLSK